MATLIPLMNGLTFAHADIETSATGVDITSSNTLFATWPAYTKIGIYVNGVYNQTISPAALGTDTTTISLPQGDKLVSFINGPTNRPDANPPLGTFLISLSSADVMAQRFADASNRMVVYGDSIAAGFEADPAVMQNAWLLRVRASRYPLSTLLEGWGTRSLNEDGATPVQLTAFVAKIAAYAPSIVWLAIGTNDYGLNKWSAANFGIAYASMLDQLHASLPNSAIFAQSLLTRSNESANSFGNIAGDYRSQIANACASRAWVRFIDGTQILALGDLVPGGVHPSPTGHAKYATFVSGTIPKVLTATYLFVVVADVDFPVIKSTDASLIQNSVSIGGFTSYITGNLTPPGTRLYAARLNADGSFIVSQSKQAGYPVALMTYLGWAIPA